MASRRGAADLDEEPDTSDDDDNSGDEENEDGHRELKRVLAVLVSVVSLSLGRSTALWGPSTARGRFQLRMKTLKCPRLECACTRLQ